MGDLHTSNLGFINNDKKAITFDVNDFDDSWIGPFYHDLIRFCTSIHLIQRATTSFTFGQADAENIVDTFLTTYKDTLASVVTNSNETTYVMTGNNLGSDSTAFTKKKLQRTSRFYLSSNINEFRIQNSYRRPYVRHSRRDIAENFYDQDSAHLS